MRQCFSFSLYNFSLFRDCFSVLAWLVSRVFLYSVSCKCTFYLERLKKVVKFFHIFVLTAPGSHPVKDAKPIKWVVFPPRWWTRESPRKHVMDVRVASCCPGRWSPTPATSPKAMEAEISPVAKRGLLYAPQITLYLSPSLSIGGLRVSIWRSIYLYPFSTSLSARFSGAEPLKGRRASF